MVEMLESLCKICATAYETMLMDGVPRDYARKCLPLATASKMRMAGNLRAWLEMLPKRMDRAAHPEVREVASKVKGILSHVSVALFGDSDEA
jgi:thymidylate synthase (FAD)